MKHKFHPDTQAECEYGCEGKPFSATHKRFALIHQHFHRDPVFPVTNWSGMVIAFLGSVGLFQVLLTSLNPPSWIGFGSTAGDGKRAHWQPIETAPKWGREVARKTWQINQPQISPIVRIINYVLQTVNPGSMRGDGPRWSPPRHPNHFFPTIDCRKSRNRELRWGERGGQAKCCCRSKGCSHFGSSKDFRWKQSFPLTHDISSVLPFPPCGPYFNEQPAPVPCATVLRINLSPI